MVACDLDERRDLLPRQIDLVAAARLERARLRRAEHVARRAFDRTQLLAQPGDPANGTPAVPGDIYGSAPSASVFIPTRPLGIRTAPGQMRSAQTANCTRPYWVWWYRQNNLTCNLASPTNPQHA